MTAATYVDWRQRWPAVITQKRTADAAEMLRRYYYVNSRGIPAYSGSQFEAIAAHCSDAYTISAADIVAVSMLSVDVPAQAAIRLLGRDAAEITALLREIPVDSDIVDVEAEELASGSAASRLWDVLRSGRDGLGPTTTSKLIAAKRPRVIPIWDSFVQEATGLDTIDYWRRFQRVLTVDDHAVWNWLTELRREVPSSVSALRVLDVLLWMSITQKRTT